MSSGPTDGESDPPARRSPVSGPRTLIGRRLPRSYNHNPKRTSACAPKVQHNLAWAKRVRSPSGGRTGAAPGGCAHGTATLKALHKDGEVAGGPSMGVVGPMGSDRARPPRRKGKRTSTIFGMSSTELTDCPTLPALWRGSFDGVPGRRSAGRLPATGRPCPGLRCVALSAQRARAHSFSCRWGLILRLRQFARSSGDREHRHAELGAAVGDERDAFGRLPLRNRVGWQGAL